MTIRRIIAAALLFGLLAGCGKTDPAAEGKPGEETEPEEETPVEYVTSDEPIPILAWYSIPENFTTIDQYRTLKDAGFNVSMTFFGPLDDALRALDCANSAGVKLLFACNALRSDTQNTVRRVKGHPALYGYYLQDEPTNADFPDLAAWADRIREVDASHPLYLNLFPDYVNPSVLSTSYEDYVKDFIRIVKLPMVSFDYYPVTTSGIRKSWYGNLALIARESEKAGLPFWAFALSTAHNPYPLPTMASLRLQFYTDLAFGAQGLQYFTYWNPGTDTWDFHDAPINQQGQKTATYALAKAMNQELQARAGVFMGAKVKEVLFTGGNIPRDMTLLTKLPEGVSKLDTKGQDALVSLLENKGVRYLMLVSRSVDKSIAYDIAFSGAAASIGKDGSITPLKKGVLSYRLDAGDCAIFRY